MLFISRHVDRAALPPSRTVIQFDFHGVVERRIWMTLEPGDVSVCLSHPELPVALTVISTVHDLYCVYLGRARLSTAIREERITLVGTSAAVRGFHHWMLWSSFAPASRALMEAPVPAESR